MPKKIDISGKQFGHWKVLRPGKKQKHTKWICRCVCGTEKEVSSYELRHGETTSCGCARLIDIDTSRMYGRLKPIEAVNGTTNLWRCLCECGKETSVYSSSLSSGRIKSCGCYRQEALDASRSTHNMSKTPEYEIWSGMKKRCYNKKEPGYKNYGGRGIKVCPEWKEDFLAFYKSVGPRPSDDHSIDRIDVNGDYCPENVRWATRKQQARNTRRTVKVSVDSKQVPLIEVYESSNPCISFMTFKRRVLSGWSFEKAASTPSKNKKTIVEAFGKTLTLKEWSSLHGVDIGTIGTRIRRGWSSEDAVSKPVV